MTLHIGKRGSITNTYEKIVGIYCGSDRIYRVYNGSDLVWQTYKVGQVVFESGIANTYSLSLATGGVYRITIVGAGGGGCGNGANGSSYSAATGAAGGGLIIDAALTKGTLSIVVGAGGTGAGGGDYQGPAAGTGGDSSVSKGGTVIGSCTGGTGGRAWFRGGWQLGVGGSPTSGAYIVNTTTSVSGSSGDGGNWNGHVYTCDVPIAGIPYGNGGEAMGRGDSYAYIGANGSNGYVKIEFIGPLNPEDYYTYTINPTPSDATVTLTAAGYTQDGNSITVYKNTYVSWSVSKTGYETQNGSLYVNSSATNNVTLNVQPLYYCYIDQYGFGYRYISPKPTTSGTYTVKWKANQDASQVSTSSQLGVSTSWNITDLLNTGFMYQGIAFNYYSSGDLYT